MTSLMPVLLLVFLGSFGAAPQGDTRSAGLTVQVTDPTGAVLTDALVVVHLQPGSGEPGVAPDESHRDNLTHLALNEFTATYHVDLSPGTYDLFVSRAGFIAHCRTLHIAGGGILTIETRMKLDPLHKGPLS
jgi:hypothetical protein